MASNKSEAMTMKFKGTKAEIATEPVTLQPRIRTLGVDDSPFMLKSLAQILNQAANFDLVDIVTDGCQALRQASAVFPDLVLMDSDQVAGIRSIVGHAGHCRDEARMHFIAAQPGWAGPSTAFE